MKYYGMVPYKKRWYHNRFVGKSINLYGIVTIRRFMKRFDHKVARQYLKLNIWEGWL